MATSATAPRNPPQALLWLAVLYTGFALTGIGTAANGALLPTLAAHLGLRDSQSGMILAAFFFGNTLGALLSRGNFARALASGFLLMALGAICLIFAGPFTILPLYFVYGVGLGLGMSATSMFIGRNIPERRAATLQLLNFAWSVGAAAAPLIVAFQLVHYRYNSFFALMASTACMVAVVAAVTLRDHGASEAAAARIKARTAFAVMAFFSTMGFLETGIEATLGGWLSTYSQRISLEDPAHAAVASSFFWVSFLVGRAVASVLLLRIRERRFFVATMVLGFAGLLTIVSAHTSTVLAVGAVIAGLGLAPIFSLNLSLFFGRASSPAHAGWVLVFCGLGGTLVPWLTGVISSATASLRLGLAGCLGCSLLMLTVVFASMLRPGGALHAANPSA